MTLKKLFHCTSKTIWSIVLISLSLFALLHPAVAGEDDKETKSQRNDQSDPKTSLCLDPSVIQDAAKSDGITDPVNPDNFARSTTSANNFINLCVGAKVTNGAQVEEGSCNPTPMGFLPSTTKMPAVRIVSPTPKTIIKAHEEFNITIAVANIKVGFFTSPKNTYYVAPQQLTSKGLIKGHVHVVAQLVDPSKPLFDTQTFAFFKGISDSASHKQISTTVTKGLPDGTYRISTLTSAMNHQLAALPVAQRGAVDDAIYIVVGTGSSVPNDDGTGQPVQTGSTTASKPAGGIQGEGKGETSNHEVDNGRGTSHTNEGTTSGTGARSTTNGNRKVCKAKRKRVKRSKPCKAKPHGRTRARV